jgi:hypothetical protein
MSEYVVRVAGRKGGHNAELVSRVVEAVREAMPEEVVVWGDVDAAWGDALLATRPGWRLEWPKIDRHSVPDWHYDGSCRALIDDFGQWVREGAPMVDEYVCDMENQTPADAAVAVLGAVKEAFRVGRYRMVK